MDDVIEIKRMLVEKIYRNDVTTAFKTNLFDLFENFEKKWIKRAINELLDDNIIDAAGAHQIEKRTASVRRDVRNRMGNEKANTHEMRSSWTDFRKQDFFYKEFIVFLTDEGILEYEGYNFDDPSKYSIEFIYLLQFFESTEEKSLSKEDITNGVISKGSIRLPELLKKLLFNSIGQTCVVKKFLPFGNESFIFGGLKNDFNTITDFGRYVLDLYKKSKKLFQKHFITNRDLVLQEYRAIDDLIELGHWKDICIKMGSILEYLLTKWLEHKGITMINHSKISKAKKLEKASFFDKVCYYLETGGKNSSFEIGKDTEWQIAQNVFRDYRNYIHLQEYEKRLSANGPLNESTFGILEPAFEEIIKYF